ncbi:RNA polymerase-binding transcription factor DksA [Pandoraea iniqua]|uniref:RNA polymerase-binding transcription factor DksA n=2 Tax=Pandoraea TaxID=93217 RepID=A0A5E4RZZ0_9BURK|nr:RNA polymerase-binding transcription factor DksA [Pandoraea iniqua]VVD69076.1 RNA polymerase-binding transcription factor DksA [Pandoraea iniqua]
MATASRKTATARPTRRAEPAPDAGAKRAPAGKPKTGEKAAAKKGPPKSPGRNVTQDAASGTAGKQDAPPAKGASPDYPKETPQKPMSKKRLLTEAEILKMGEKDYMNEDQLAFFKDRLEKLQEEILRNAGQTTENLRETILVPDPADRATIEEEHALELRTRDRERKLLKKVQQSLARIESGEYGWCEETGEPIGIPRLLARPTATLSLEAQERRELRQKLFGD